MFQLTPIVKNILIINVVLLGIESFLNFDLGVLFGVHYLLSEDFYIFQYVSYMWLHAGFWHLLSNMFAVWVFGPMLERVWGAKRFLAFYLISGIGAGLLYGLVGVVQNGTIGAARDAFLSNPNPEAFYIYVNNYGEDKYDMVKVRDFADQYYEQSENLAYIDQAKKVVKDMYHATTNTNMIGASGAVFAILLAFAMLFPNTELLLLFPPIPIKAKYLVFAYAAYEIYAEINKSGGDNISHFTHLSGMLVAFIILKYWQSKRGNFY